MRDGLRILYSRILFSALPSRMYFTVPTAMLLTLPTTVLLTLIITVTTTTADASTNTSATTSAIAAATTTIAQQWQAIQDRCVLPKADEPVVHQQDFSWGMNFEEMQKKYDELYSSPKRLAGRAYYDRELKSFILPFGSGSGHFELPPRTIESVQKHIEKALALGYADFVFFPDMGHSHFFIPTEIWEKKFRTYPSSDRAGFFSKLFNEPALKILYHTAEQLETTEEDLKQVTESAWRFYTRNIVGDNQGRGELDIHRNLRHSANTVKSYDGHFYYGGGFFIGAHENGCFPFTHKGKTSYFDITMTYFPSTERIRY